jgi:hypothetical protein
MLMIKVGHVGNKIWYKDGVLHRDGDLPAVEWPSGTKIWYKDGKLHRDGDRPAIEWSDGSKEWYKDGVDHRDGDLPAVVHACGSKEWWYNGNMHRVGGPAWVRSDGTLAWCFEGHEVTEEQHNFIYRMHTKRGLISKLNLGIQ